MGLYDTDIGEYTELVEMEFTDNGLQITDVLS